MMLPIFLKTLPFFAVIGLGYLAGRLRAFPEEATAWLTKFVFYFALSAMLFRLTVTLPLAEIWNLTLVLAYLLATGGLYGVQFLISRLRGVSLAEATIEAQCGTIGNTGFLGIPMLAVLLGPASAGPLLMILSLDMIVFSTLVTLLLTAAKRGAHGRAALGTLARGIAANPMIVSMAAGFLWAGIGLPLPAPMEETLALLAVSATPCALFAIGASLSSRRAERLAVAGWLSFSKLVLHPAAVAAAAFALGVEPGPAGVMIAAAALPVAGNIYILAQHYQVAPQRVSAAILISTAAGILTLPPVIAWITTP